MISKTINNMPLRDSGHRELYEKSEALHRQVTLDNVMLGRPGALAGNRGILIGLDLAKGEDSDASVEWHSVSRSQLSTSHDN
jgi:hypothetical protein